MLEKLKNIIYKIKLNKEKIFYNIIYICISLVLFLNVIFIGSDLNENSEIIRVVSTIICISVVLFQKIKLKEKYSIVKNKLDICLIILLLTAIGPLVFKTYISLHGCLNSILRYISAFSLYIVVRDLILYDKKYKKRILNVILIAGIATALIGIDDMTTKIFSNIIFRTGNLMLENAENRMYGVFTYANTFAIAIAVALIIAISNYLEEDNKIIKKVYPFAIFILGSALILSYSRMTFILMSIALVILFFAIKDKNKKIEYVKLIIFTSIAIIIYINIFTQIQITQKYMLLWIITLIESLVLVLVLESTRKFNKILENIKYKEIAIISLVIISILIIFIVIGLRATEPLHLFEDTKNSDVYAYRIRNVEKNKVYNFKFNIEAESNVEDNYEFIIMEQNQAFTTTKEDKHIFSNFNGIKEINFETTDEAFLISIYVKNTNMQENQSFIIKECKINDKILPLKYKFFPIELVDKIKEIKITDQSVTSRQVYWKDSIKLIIKNPILGYGGDSFKFLRPTVQEVFYETAKTHSFPLEIFLENGIIGIIAYLSIIIIFIIYIVKDKNKTILEIEIVLAIAILILHSAMDFDMTYIYILFDFYILLACISTEEDNNKFKIVNQKSILDFLLLIVLVFNIYGNFNLRKYEDKARWNKLVEKFLKEDDLVDQMLEYRKDERYQNYNSQLDMITILIESEIKKGDFTHLEGLYQIIEEPYAIMDIRISSKKIGIAEEIKQRCNELYEQTKKEEYNQISKRLKKFITDYTLKLEKAWINNQDIAVTKDEYKVIMNELQEIKQRNQ